MSYSLQSRFPKLILHLIPYIGFLLSIFIDSLNLQAEDSTNTILPNLERIMLETHPDWQPLASFATKLPPATGLIAKHNPGLPSANHFGPIINGAERLYFNNPSMSHLVVASCKSGTLLQSSLIAERLNQQIGAHLNRNITLLFPRGILAGKTRPVILTRQGPSPISESWTKIVLRPGQLPTYEGIAPDDINHLGYARSYTLEQLASRNPVALPGTVVKSTLLQRMIFGGSTLALRGAIGISYGGAGFIAYDQTTKIARSIGIGETESSFLGIYFSNAAINFIRQIHYYADLRTLSLTQRARMVFAVGPQTVGLLAILTALDYGERTNCNSPDPCVRYECRLKYAPDTAWLDINECFAQRGISIDFSDNNESIGPRKRDWQDFWYDINPWHWY